MSWFFERESNRLRGDGREVGSGDQPIAGAEQAVEEHSASNKTCRSRRVLRSALCRGFRRRALRLLRGSNAAKNSDCCSIEHDSASRQKPRPMDLVDHRVVFKIFGDRLLHFGDKGLDPIPLFFGQKTQKALSSIRRLAGDEGA